MTALATTDALFFRPARPRRRRGPPARRDRRLRGWRAVPGVSGERGRSRSMTGASARPSYDATRGFGPACRQRRGGPAMPMRASCRMRRWHARGDSEGGAAGPVGRDRGRAASNQRAALFRCEPAHADGFRGEDRAAAGNRRLRPRRDPRVKQVMASITGEWQAVQIIRPDGQRVADLRPLVRVSISVVVEQDGRRETGSFGTGGRFEYARVLTEEGWKAGVEEAPAPGAGEPRQRAGAGG
jgi:TldD protein